MALVENPLWSQHILCGGNYDVQKSLRRQRMLSAQRMNWMAIAACFVHANPQAALDDDVAALVRALIIELTGLRDPVEALEIQRSARVASYPKNMPHVRQEAHAAVWAYMLKHNQNMLVDAGTSCLKEFVALKPAFSLIKVLESVYKETLKADYVHRWRPFRARSKSTEREAEEDDKENTLETYAKDLDMRRRKSIDDDCIFEIDV